MTELSLTQCCLAIINGWNNRYAHAYAWAWLNGDVKDRCEAYGVPLSDGVRAQALYLLSNISHWRGETAVRVRRSLKEMTKGE